MEDILFLGSNSSYETFKKKHHIDDIDHDEEEQKEEANAPKSAKVLSKENLREITDDEITILRRTRTAYDYNEVRMQSKLEFYDTYYNDNDVSKELKAVRQIRRVYKIYSDYLDAIQRRNDYIDFLVDKYGGPDEFNKKLLMGFVKDWIPPMPILSSKCPEYDLYKAGQLPNAKEEEVDPQFKFEVLESMQKALEEDGIEVRVDSDVVTSIGDIRLYEQTQSEAADYYKNYRGSSVSSSISDLESLNRVFRSWYKDDGLHEETHEIFKNAPENIRKRFLEHCNYKEPGLLTKIASGEEIEEPAPNPNEMVFDERTGRNMTRIEHEKRELIRLMASSGWSESRMMNYQSVGSTLERMRHRSKPSKKRRVASYDDNLPDINLHDDLETLYCDDEQFLSTLSGFMKGD